MTKKLKVGIFGITGAVGQELLKVIQDRDFPVESLRAFASERSVGKEFDSRYGRLIVENANTADFSEFDLAFFAIGGGWPKENARKATDSGCVVVDNSSTFRYDDEVPLIIPEINPDAIGDSKLIANPNCTTAIAAIPIYQVYKDYGIRKVIISTYQATSGAGNNGMAELTEATKQYLESSEKGQENRNQWKDKIIHEVFQYPIAFNLIPHIDKFQDNSYTKEEMKVVWESKKIFGDDSLKISCTCVRIPTMRAHSESIVIETDKPVDPEDVKKLFSNTDGIVLKDDIENNIYPMPLNATEKYDVEVGRVRENLVFGDHGIEFFVSGDQLLKGAALNAIQIAEKMLEQGRFG